jgi:hypothetical protein
MLGHLKTRRFSMEGEVTSPGVNEAKETYWQRTLQVWKDSGLTASEFQRQNNLSKHAFVYWKLKLIGRSEKSHTLVPVRVRPATRAAVHPCCIRLGVGELFTIEVTAGFDEQTLRQVLAILRESAE